MGGIFVSYRRQDSAGHARALYDRLRERFRQRVFMDVEGIEPGVDFVEVIENAVGNCEVLLALIGREWSDIADEKGARRLEDPHDFIRLEVATALSRNVIVVPVLLEGAAMPNARALPNDIAKLARRQAIELRDNRWDADVDALMQRLEKVLDQAPRDGAGQRNATAEVEQRGAGDSASRQTATRPPTSGHTATAGSNAGDRRSTTPEETTGNPDQRASERADDRGANTGGTGATGHKDQGGGGARASTSKLRPLHLAIAGAALAIAGAVGYMIQGGGKVSVPDVVGSSLEVATERLKTNGLVVGETARKRSREAAPNTVLDQAPNAGRQLARGEAVKLLLAERPPLVVPQSLDKPLETARAELGAAGLSVGSVTQEATDRARPGTVLRMQPGPGSEIAAQTGNVDIVVAAAPERKIAKPAAPPVPPVAAQPTPTPPAGDQAAKVDPTPKPATQDVARQQRTLRLIYGGEQSRAQAESLAGYFRQLGWTIESVTAGPAPGTRVQYATDEQRALAESVANRASWWLGQQGRPNVSFPLARAGTSQGNTPMTLWLSEPVAPVVGTPAPTHAPTPAPSSKPAGPRASGDAAIRVGAGLSVAGGGESSGREADVTLDQRVDPTQTQWFLTPQNRARVAQVRAATQEECAQASYYDIPIPTRQLRTGSIICVRNANGAFAALQVKRVPNYGYYQLDVGYTIW